MSEPVKVLGEECLKYVDKPIGFASKGNITTTMQDLFYLQKHANTSPTWNGIWLTWRDKVELIQFRHDVSKRIIGVVDRKYSDGGYKVKLLGNETITLTDEDSCRNYEHEFILEGFREYEPKTLDPRAQWQQKGDYQFYPNCPGLADMGNNSSGCKLTIVTPRVASFVETMEWFPDFDDPNDLDTQYAPYCIQSGTITNDLNNTLVFGNPTSFQPKILPEFKDDPLRYLCGDLYKLAYDRNLDCVDTLCPKEFITQVDFETYDVTEYETLMEGNNVSVPYNIILTYNSLYAQAYLETGTLPPDAFLFPLDWDSLPSYDPDDEKDDDEDNDQDDDNKPGFDGDPDLPEVPTFPPSSLSNNNYYWLNVGQLENFVSWFWNDVGELSDFEDLINKVKGLYNDLGSTILMLRYMPVDIANLGGLGEPSPIILGMIEKSGNVPTISKNPPPIVDIGHVKVPKEYKSFASHSPYAQCTLYLPFFGYLELDMDMFTGHEVYVKAIYDYLTGTIQYLIYYENKFLVNSMVCKMAVDIPITLQSKNDRDSAIFQNVSNAMAGLTSGTMSLASGNPIGLLGLGQAVNAGQQSAPLSVRGIVGEQGAFYAPNKCKLITTFPVQQKPSNFNEICGKQTNKTYTLSKISGYTECYNPRITFDKTVPLHEEEEEIYNYLEKGVIL